MKKRTLFTVLAVILCCLVLLCSCSNKKEPLRVLSIGSSYSWDSIYYLPAIAKLDGYSVEAAYLDAGDATLRDHAHNLTYYGEYTYRTCDADGGWIDQGSTTIGDVLEQYAWNVVILQHHPYAVGFPSTYNSDLEYLLDTIHAKTDAKVYWNMSWAMQDGITDGKWSEGLNTYYDGSQALMYNAIVHCLDTYIIGENAIFKDDFNGWIPTGAAIQILRGTLQHDLALTSNGGNLSYDIGRLTAALTLTKTLLPDFELDTVSAAGVQAFLDTDKYDEVLEETDLSNYVFAQSDIALALDAVSAACALSGVPETLDTPQPEQSTTADVTAAQTAAPLKVYFPDAATLSDGTVILGVYENISHKPEIELGEADGCAGRLVVCASTDNGGSWGYDTPLLVVDEAQMERWGIAKVSDRYSVIASGSLDYTISADPRDPNFGTVYTDINGDGTDEEVLLFTFWICYRSENALEINKKNQMYLCWSTDGSTTWSSPQALQSGSGNTSIIKRGNIASFADGQILIPYYTNNTAGSLLMEYDAAKAQWSLISDNAIPNFAPEESDKFNEVSLVAPDPDSDTVYAFCRDNGTVLRSDDRGARWELIGNEDGVIHQPGFAILDSQRVFTTWALTVRPRNTYGKVFYVNGDWTDTQAQLIYESSDPVLHDMADPSCVLLADGRVLVVSYDTAYRSIVGVYADPNESQWQPE